MSRARRDWPRRRALPSSRSGRRDARTGRACVLGDGRDASRSSRDDATATTRRRRGRRPGDALPVTALDGGAELPDPASRCAARRRARRRRRSSIRRFAWTDAGLRGLRRSPSYVLYELHVGTFTEAGTFDAAIGRLDDLARARRHRDRADAGRRVPGRAQLGLRRRRSRSRRSRTYGGPDGLRRLVDAAPRPRPRGRARRRLQPPRPGGERPRASSARTSPTGTARRGARRSTSTARAATRCAATSSRTRSSGCDDFHIDALRLDAVHAIVDPSAYPFVEELTT